MKGWRTIAFSLALVVGGQEACASELGTVLVAGMEMPAVPASFLKDTPVKVEKQKQEEKAKKEKVAPGHEKKTAAASKSGSGKVSRPGAASKPMAVHEASSIKPEPVTSTADMPKARAVKRKRVIQKETMVARVTPGVNEIIKISQGHLNRIITPFERPVVETVSRATIKSKAGSLYVTSNDSYPITMFVHEKGEDDPAISLTLIPSFIPPRQIRLVIADSEGGLYPLASAGKWEKGHPYVESLKKGMTALAKQMVPHGYGLRRWKHGDPEPACANRRQGISVRSKQVIEGQAVVYVVAAVKNISKGSIELAEPLCYEKGVLAVAYWPRVVLKPGEKTELYVAYARPKRPESRQRKSVIE